ncbi:MAG: carboxypeptidase-like regulatory domain-containing protein [Gelidibacter sp.]
MCSTQEIDGKMAPIRNVGIPINSNADDFAFHIDEATGEGFVSSNREGGLGVMMSMPLKLQPICDVLVTGTVTDIKTGQPINAASVALYDDEGNKVLSKVTNSDGTVEFIVECSKDTALEVTMDGYESRRVAVKGTQEEK